MVYKRHWDLHDDGSFRDSGKGSVALHKLKKYKRHLTGELGRDQCRRDFAMSLLDVVDKPFVTNLLVRYKGTEDQIDKEIYDVLFCLERTYRIGFFKEGDYLLFSESFQSLTPLVFGERAKHNYENLQSFGHSLSARLTSEEVLDFLDPEMMWFTLSNFSDSPYSLRKCKGNQIYDARFVLRLLVSVSDVGMEVSNKKFIQCNALSFALAATSLYERENRALAYVILHRFLNRLSDLSLENFNERPFYLYVLRVFRNSIEKSNQRIPHDFVTRFFNSHWNLAEETTKPAVSVVSLFMAEVVKLFLCPENPLYRPILSFFLLKPTLNMEDVPEFYKLLLSSSTDQHQEERRWILRLIADSLIEPYDYNIMQKRFGVKLCLSLFGSCMSDWISRRYVLFILSAALRHSSVAHDLFHRHNLLCWIATTIQVAHSFQFFFAMQEKDFITRWEASFLCQLFVNLLVHFESRFSKDIANVGPSFGNSERRVCQMLCRKVLQVICKEDDKGKSLWFDKLTAYLESDGDIRIN
ncbi:unnamed protein product [Enterobius vermicularis]|uniref:NopRA1 domain-containing protein n=1 Tax=Enterobius vermicularis TaxID=51028 RepID=A0A0N4V702_ENTVE|nr:unnamed protein product [Enterobius vermicularis]